MPPNSNSLTTVVLLVEDEPLIRYATEVALRDMGYRTIAATNGYEALSALEEHRDITVMVTDLAMPKMDGRELARRAQAQYPALKIILTTGYDPTPGALCTWPVVNKPYLSEELAEAIEAALAAS